MKIKKLEFIQHPVFQNHTVEFDDNGIRDITFLVGNNGSGKTHILDMLYFLLSAPHSNPLLLFEVKLTLILTDNEKSQHSIKENEIIYHVLKSPSRNHSTVTYLSGEEINVHLPTITKVVQSTIEVNFNNENIGSVTSRNIDDNILPKDRSVNISMEIPQLLIDIQALDDADRSKWMRDNRDTTVLVPADIGTRMERFVGAFHKIYGGQKTFSHIKNVDNGKQITFVDTNNSEVGLNQMSTGEKQIIYRIGYILKNLGNLHGGIVLIDEPEISLHPQWQLKLKDFLLELFHGYDVQLIIATHSPYIFKNLDETKEICIKVDRTLPTSRRISMMFPGVAYNPSVQLIGYLAYGIADEMLHIELYTLLQIRENRSRIKNTSGQNNGIEDWLQDPAGGNIAIAQTFTRSSNNSIVTETIMTWIRNKLHHADDPDRPNFTGAHLIQSINEMIRLLRNP